MTSELQLIAILILLVTFVINATQVFRRRRGAVPLRPISAFEQVPVMVNTGIEANRPLHIGWGNVGVGTQRTLQALVASEFAYYATRYATYSDTSPIISTSDTSALPLAMDVLRRAYQSRGLVDGYRPVYVRWYPNGENSLVMAGGIMAMHADDNVSSHMLIGSFGAEMALILDASHRYQRPTLAISDDLSGQAVAYALADNVLIGEEIFASESYLGDSISARDRLTAIDLMRWGVVVAIIALMGFTLLNSGS